MSSSDNSLKPMVYAAMFGALTAIGALIVIPLQPVPVTLQTLFTSLAGILLGSSVGAMSQVVYVLLGIMGLPVFAGGKAGLGILFGPTGGYLIGFIVAAYVIGKIVKTGSKPSLTLLVIALVAGNMVIYMLGTVQLMILTNLSLTKALLIGVIPFLPGDLFKLIAAVWLSLKLYQYFPFKGGNLD